MELEKKLIPHIKKVSDRNSYIELLRLMYGFYHPIQRLVQPWLLSLTHSGHHRGRQSQNIISDISALDGGSQPIFQTNKTVPVITSYPEALGALYVTEGSTLGGQIIANMLVKQVSEDISGSLSFFNAYGYETKELWLNFRELLNQPFSGEDQDKITATARATFSSFKSWINTHESATRQ